MVNQNLLSAEEEKQVDEICAMLSFLDEKDVQYYYLNNYYSFHLDDYTFRDHMTGRVITPHENIIKYFHFRLTNKAVMKLHAEKRRTSIDRIDRLLIRFYDFKFLPLGW